MLKSDEAICKDIYKAMEDKFQAGKKEHGGHLSDMTPKQLAWEVLNEAIDQVFYAYYLWKKL
jgi:hypothetical protein